MDKIYELIFSNTAMGKIERELACEMLTTLKKEESIVDNDIAIIGMSFQFPFADNPRDFWSNIKYKIDCITRLPESRKHDIDRYLNYAKIVSGDYRYTEGAYLDHIDFFDCDFFRLTPKEASLMDPCQRLFMQVAWQALEDAGYGGKILEKSKTGVYLGYATIIKDSYQKMIYEVDPNDVPISIAANLAAIIPTRLSYLLNLNGPTMVIDTACSSSLVAVHLACQGIKNGDCDMAIAGGIKIHLLPLDDPNMKIGIEASDGRTRAFDDSSDGSGIGEGVAAIIIKPLSKALHDKDHIYGVIKGSAINQDGRSIGITAPNPKAQTEVIVKAWENAGIGPDSIVYIETHGTGTTLGDPIEIEGLQNAFQRYGFQKKQHCAIGSVKTNIGHTYECAGLANLIKVILALKEQELPPVIHFSKPNQAIDFENAPFYVNTKTRKWNSNGAPRMAGVSSFGFSGTNCHMVVQEAPGYKVARGALNPNPQVFTLSARNESSLARLINEYQRFVNREPDLDFGDICFTANTGRGHYNCRIALLTRDFHELKDQINQLAASKIPELNLPWLFYGEHRLVPETKEILAASELTEKTRQALNDQARLKLIEFMDTGKKNPKLISELCRLYTQGADIAWEELYQNENLYRVSLPVYQFEPKRCWMNIPEGSIEAETIVAESLFYTTGWIRHDLSGQTNDLIHDPVLVLRGKHHLGVELVERLRSEGREVIEVTLGKKFKTSGAYQYEIGNTPAGYESLLASLSDKRLSWIVHLLTLENKGPETELDQSQQYGVYSLFNLVNAMAKHRPNQIPNLLLISSDVYEVTGAEKQLHPENSPFFGLGKVIPKEIPEIICRCIDLDESAGALDLLRELKARASASEDSSQVVYRDGQRYIEELREADLQSNPENEISFKEDGVYLITGGAGGIGMEIAHFLAGPQPIQLAFINRTPFPERNTWEDIMAQEVDSKLRRKINKIKQIEANGSKVFCYQADIGQRSEVKELLDLLRREFGRINGIIHGAGLASSELTVNESWESFQQVLAPKVNGTWILDQLTQEDPLDFFVTFSSIAAVISAMGQGSYTAANLFLDAFAAYRNKQGRKTLNINWTTWKETGMSVDYGINVDTTFKAMPTSQAVNGFQQALGHTLARVIIGVINYEGGKAGLLERASLSLSAAIRGQIEKSKERLSQRLKQKDSKTTGEVKLEGRENQDYTEIEQKLAELCREILGFSEISIYDSFFELGADSILLKRMHTRIDELYPGRVMIADLFQYSNIFKLGQFIAGKLGNMAQTPVTRPKTKENKANNDIAIIGISAILPNATSVDAFWQNIRAKIDCIMQIPKNRLDDLDDYVHHFGRFPTDEIKYLECAYIDEIDKFDPGFFRLSPKEASLMDPGHRLFLETVWHAIEDAGYGGKRIAGTKTGVYVGYYNNLRDNYQKIISEVEPTALPISMTGNLSAMLPSRISYLLNLKGPTMVIDTACSSSLVAVNVACQALRNGTCEMAIAGGVKIHTVPLDLENGRMGIESSDGRTRTFSDKADGSGVGEGVAAILLKPLDAAIADKDYIYGVIKGSAVNQDGSSISLTAPNPAAQTDVILEAWEDAGIDPTTISYIIAHGTATNLGDPIEVKSIQNAFARYTKKKQFCAIGTPKTNIGHLFEAAGIVNLIFGIMALRNREIPSLLCLDKPNREINFEESPVYVNTRVRKWITQGEPRRCGISAFGFSGTNCHVVLEEAPSIVKPAYKTPKSPLLLALSVKSKESLTRLVENYDSYINQTLDCDIKELCFTANTGREHHNYRLAFLVRDLADLKEKLSRARAGDLGELDACGIYYGYHKVVANNKTNPEAQEISEEAKLELSRRANLKFTEFIENGQEDPILAAEILQFYIKGADLDWEELYQGESIQKITLPVYPFERRKCWIEIPEVAAAQEKLAADGLHYSVNWIVAENSAEVTGGASHFQPGGMVIVFLDEKGIGRELAARLRKQNQEVIEVTFGSEFIPKAPGEFLISGAEADYGRLVEQVNLESLTRIIHLAGITSKTKTMDLTELKNSQRKGFDSLFYMTRAMAKQGLKNNIDLVLIAEYVNAVTGHEPRIIPENAPLFGLGKVLPKELTEISCRCIDIDEQTDPEKIWTELQATGVSSPVAYRDGRRYIEEFGLMDLDRVETRALELQNNGVYLITGGTGGIGLELAGYLAGKSRIKLALVNRSRMPEREMWDQILSEGAEPKICKRINKIREIEVTGSEVECYAADISDYGQAAQLFGNLRQKYGRINGIVHAAGIGGAELVVNQDEAVMREGMAPKIQGTWNMNLLIQAGEPDFFITCSSIATVFTAPGQGAYAAANAFLDSFAAYRNQSGQRTLCVNWTTWKETGMAVDHGANIDTTFKALPTSQAIKALDEVFDKAIGRVVVGMINYEGGMARLLENSALKLSKPIQSKIDQFKKQMDERLKSKARKSTGKIKLIGRESEEYTEIEKKIAEICRELLGFSEISIHDSFFELGVDSILLKRIHGKIEEVYPGQVMITELFEYSTISKLALYIAGKQTGEAAGATEPVNIEREINDILGEMESGSLSIDEVLHNISKL
ncbi:MAG TPA: SDR family NAD(P)-dependent oxidoreductase [Bacillota bacterium]|nr:SDR family NAD(P)-dependent oxidoreductase [Bacillota bacterium]